MFSKTLVAVALASTAFAQLDTKCDPLKTSCPDDPAFGNQKVHCDLTKSVCDELKPIQGTYIEEFSEKGALFSIEQDGQAPTLETKKYLFFGRVDVTMQAAPGAGIVSSIVLFSDDRDEIDWEFVGNSNKVQSNTFSKGDSSKHDLVSYNPVDNPFGSLHTYSIEWTRHAVKWSIDGSVVHTVKQASIPDRFPQTPMQVRFGPWVGGGSKSPPGQVDWAGGKADFSKAPFKAYYKSISIVDYAGGDGPASKKVNSYSYGDHSGSWKSIKFDPEGSGNVGEDNGDGDDKPETKSSKPADKTSSADHKTSADKTSMSTPTTTSHATESTPTAEETSSADATKTDSASETETQTKDAGDSSPTAKSSGARAGVAAGSLVVAVAALFAML